MIDSTMYKLGALVTKYRIAIEEATDALAVGKYEEARAALARVESPVRSGEAVPRTLSTPSLERASREV